MAKWADYLVSHVKRDSQERVTHVLLHEDNGDSVSRIGVKTKAEVIRLLKQGKSVITVNWGYPNWKKGANVSYVRGSNGEFLRTDGNKTDRDNLDNMIPLPS